MEALVSLVSRLHREADPSHTDPFKCLHLMETAPKKRGGHCFSALACDLCFPSSQQAHTYVLKSLIPTYSVKIRSCGWLLPRRKARDREGRKAARRSFEYTEMSVLPISPHAAPLMLQSCLEKVACNSESRLFRAGDALRHSCPISQKRIQLLACEDSLSCSCFISCSR